MGTSSGTIVYPGLAGPSTVQIPAGAYTQPVQITLQTPASLTCSASPAENLTPTNIGLEATLSPNIEPSQPVGLSMSYQNANVTAFTPGSFVIARCDTTTGVWVPLASTVDPLTQAVTAISDHLSVFQIMQATLLTSVSQFKIGPNPLRPSRGQHQMRFLGPPNTEIRIYTLTGQLVKELTTAADGTAAWDATNKSGRDVASGVYFIFVKASGKSETYKAIVER